VQELEDGNNELATCTQFNVNIYLSQVGLYEKKAVHAVRRNKTEHEPIQKAGIEHEILATDTIASGSKVTCYYATADIVTIRRSRV